MINREKALAREVKELKKQIAILKRKLKKERNIPRCPLCRCLNVVKRGTRPTEHRGTIQTYLCKDCDYKFSRYNKLEYRMRQSNVKIEEAIRLRKKGYTFSQIANKIKGVSRQTVLRWLQKFDYKPTKETIVKVRMKSRWGTYYYREFKIKV